MSLRYVILLVAFGVCLGKEKRSVGIFAAKEESPLSHHQVWKVHKYSGVELKPVHPEHEYIGEQHYSEDVPRTVQIPDHYEDDHAFIGRSNEAYGTPLPEEKVGTHIIPSLVLKKKKKLGIVAISNLLKSKKHKWHKGGVGILGGLFGSEGETDDYPYAQTSVYRDVPTSPSFFSRIPFLNGFNKGHVVHLPEPSIPHIPALKLVPEAPQLPNLGFSTHYKLPYSTGSYVSIRAPKPHIKHEVYSPPVTDYEHKEHEIEYGLPHPSPVEFSAPYAPAPSAPYPPEPSAPYPPAPEPSPYPPPAPAPEYGLPSYKYSGPSSYQTSFDHTHHAEKRQSTQEETEKEAEEDQN